MGKIVVVAIPMDDGMRGFSWQQKQYSITVIYSRVE
jgi:hypothetical protein